MKGLSRNLLTWIIIGFVIGIVTAAANSGKSTITLAPVAAFFLFLYLDIYIHECGHALSGLIVKFPIKHITIGTGMELFRKKFAGILLVIMNSPGGGMTHIGSVSKHFLKPRYSFFVAGGVILQCLFIWAVLAISGMTLSELFNIKQFSFVHALIYSNMLLVFQNIYPRTIVISGVPHLNDGAQLLRLPSLAPNEIQEILATGKVIEAYELFEAKEYDTAENLSKECSRHFPGSLIPKINLSATYLKQFKPDKTITCLEPLLKECKQNQYMFFIYNNLAWAHFLKFNEQDLQRANNYLVKATSLRRPVDEKNNIPISFFALAYGYYLTGKLTKSLQYMEKFRTYGKPLDKDDQAYYDYIMVKTNGFSKIC